MTDESSENLNMWVRELRQTTMHMNDQVGADLGRRRMALENTLAAVASRQSVLDGWGIASAISLVVCAIGLITTSSWMDEVPPVLIIFSVISAWGLCFSWGFSSGFGDAAHIIERRMEAGGLQLGLVALPRRQPCDEALTKAARYQALLAEAAKLAFDDLPAKPDTRFAWTPRGSPMGSILLPTKPTKVLTSDMFWSAIRDRITALVEAEDVATARELLRKAERNEPQLNIDDIRHAGEQFVTASGWLRSKINFPGRGVPTDMMEHDPDTKAFLLDETLESFLNELYCDPS